MSLMVNLCRWELLPPHCFLDDLVQDGEGDLGGDLDGPVDLEVDLE